MKRTKFSATGVDVGGVRVVGYFIGGARRRRKKKVRMAAMRLTRRWRRRSDLVAGTDKAARVTMERGGGDCRHKGTEMGRWCR